MGSIPIARSMIQEKREFKPEPAVFEKMPAEKFLAELAAEVEKRPDAIFERRGAITYETPEGKKDWDFVRIASKEINPEDKILFIRAGLHGEEIAGPLTMRWHINEIIDYAHQNGLKVVIYPLANPSGFESGKRFNIADDLGGEGSEGTDDIIRYELLDGELVDELEENQPFKRWFFSAAPRINVRLPQEAALMRKELKELPVSQIVAAVDLHQDYITPDAPPAAYHYNHNDQIVTEVYRKIVEKIEQELPIMRGAKISAGFKTSMKSDKYGFITRHDGSLIDAMYRLRTKHCIVVETTGATSLEIADKVNMVWIKGIIDQLK